MFAEEQLNYHREMDHLEDPMDQARLAGEPAVTYHHGAPETKWAEMLFWIRCSDGTFECVARVRVNKRELRPAIRINC